MELLEVLKSRRSVRKFTNKPIPREIIDNILQGVATWCYINSEVEKMSLSGSFKPEWVDPLNRKWWYHSPEYL